MPRRPDTLETVVIALRLLQRIPRGHRKVTAPDLHSALEDAGFERDLRSVQRLLDALSQRFDIERDVRSKPYGYRWKDLAKPLAVPTLTPQESLLLMLAQAQLKNLLPPRVLKSMEGLLDQACYNLAPGSDAKLEREWPSKVRVVPTSQPLLPPQIKPGVLETVSEALYLNRWLHLGYRNAGGKQSEIEVMPLGLAQQGPSLYLVCRYQGFDNERSLALHRMQAAKMSTLTFEGPKGFDLAKYDEDGRFGFGEGKRIRLRFRITREAGQHLLETPLSADQKIVENRDGHLAVTATVVDSAMLTWWLRGFGEAVWGVRRGPVGSHYSAPNQQQSGTLKKRKRSAAARPTRGKE